MSTLIWTDRFGRSYPYKPYSAAPIADADVALGGAAGLALAEASRALGALPELPLGGIAAVLYRSESSASSIIEGITAGPRRILEAEFARPDEIADEIGLRVVSNLHGLTDAIGTNRPPRSDDYLRWHRLLTAGHPMMSRADIGAYRTRQNWIGGDDSGPRNASFVPPAPEQLGWLISDLEAFCARTDLAPLVQSLIAHGRFEVIHPFVDGNGRVGRMLLQSLLVRRLALAGPVPVSVVWSRNPDRYVAGLRAYQDGDVNGWIETAAASLIEAVDWTRRAGAAITELVAVLRARAGVRGESVAARIIADLPAYPLLDGPTVAQRYAVSSQAAHGALTRLEKRNVLVRRALTRRKRTEGRPRQVYTAPDLVDLLKRLATE